MVVFNNVVFSVSSPNQDVLLVDSNGNVNPSAGQVQVYREGQWGAVCGTRWDQKDAKIVCGQLGFDEDGSQAQTVDAPASVPAAMDFVSCWGNEDSLTECHSADMEMAPECYNNAPLAAVVCENGKGRTLVIMTPIETCVKLATSKSLIDKLNRRSFLNRRN